MRFQLRQDPKTNSIRQRVNPIQSAPEILPMIDASSSNVPRRASGCQSIMGHHVGLRGRVRQSMAQYRNGTTGSCSLRTAGIATLSINHRSMTGTCSVSHEFDSSNLHFVVRCWACILLSRPGPPLIGRRYRHGVSHGTRRRGGIENWYNETDYPIENYISLVSVLTASANDDQLHVDTDFAFYQYCRILLVLSIINALPSLLTCWSVNESLLKFQRILHSSSTTTAKDTSCDNYHLTMVHTIRNNLAAALLRSALRESKTK